MAGYTAIGDVGATLVSVLREEMSLVDGPQVALAAPDAAGGGTIRLTVYLYEVAEQGELRNQLQRPDEAARATGSAAVSPDRAPGAPVPLELRYLVTAHPAGESDGDQLTRTTRERHEVLGQAVQVLGDNAVVAGAELEGDAFGDEDSIRISMDPPATDTAANIWGTFEDSTFGPSVGYRVTPVVVESGEERAVSRVEERQIDEYQLGTRPETDG